LLQLPTLAPSVMEKSGSHPLKRLSEFAPVNAAEMRYRSVKTTKK